ncbi:MAG TPA: alpha/beta fold hydrolase [Candidatus Eisenbacteria bacterium]|jgi:2,6-dihydroxypseudooxynicotine hydrolase
MAVRGGRLEFLVPHLLRSQLLRPGFVRLSLRLGVAQQMPPWAKLQFTNAGVSPRDLERVLGRITSLSSWVDEWEGLGREHEQGARDALKLGRRDQAAERFLAASSAYNFAQYVMFLDIERKRILHQACVRAYAAAGPLFDPPAERFEVTFRRQTMVGYLRRPRDRQPAPVAVLFNGTNAVKEEMHWWAEAMLQRGLAVITFDGPGLGQTFHRLSMVAEPRPVGVALLNQIESRPELDPEAVVFFGMSLGGYLAIRMASHDPRVKAVAAISPPYSADIYWNVTLASMRRELAALYDIDEREMGAAIHRITLADMLPRLRRPLLVAGGGRDMITPGSEAWRIFDGARCERELIYYPGGAHDCFNVLADLRPRVASWIARQAARHQGPAQRITSPDGAIDGWMAAEAVDPDFADALQGEVAARAWHREPRPVDPARGRWPWSPPHRDSRPDVVHRLAPALPDVLRPTLAPDTPDALPAG